MSTASHSAKQLAAREGISAIERQDVDAASDPPPQT